ncbi:MAG: hypothetical protein IJ680_00635 [Paludibacteraceae bacterium]|nr:hypothetical protein [Paludibacteraceae bacterium]
MRYTARTICLTSATLLLLAACGGSHRDTRRTRYTDLGDVRSLPVEVIRFDSIFLSADTAQTDDVMLQLAEQYADFTNVWAWEILGVDTSEHDNLNAMARSLRLFLSDLEIDRKIQAHQADFEQIGTRLGDAYARMQSLGFEISVPQIYCYVSGLQKQPYYYELTGLDKPIIGNGTYYAVSTDMYLGADEPIYHELANVNQYQLNGMNPEYIASDIMLADLFMYFPYEPQQDRLIDNMIYYGRIYYILSVLFPDLSGKDIIEYTAEQWDWCIENEANIWGQVLSNKDLFQGDQMLVSKYMSDAPYTEPISRKAPGRLGAWIGWRIVEQYMENNTDISLQQLMQHPVGAQTLLEQSAYKP